MGNLRVLRLRLPGMWSDGWLYKEHLILWSRTGTSHVVGLDELAREVRKETTATLAVAADYLIFRNDWKASEQFRSLCTVPGIQRSLLQDFPSEGGEITVQLKSFAPAPILSEAVPGFILDSNVYANRLYVGSTEGLFEGRFYPDDPEGRNPLVQRLTFRVNAISAKYSVVNSSAEESGLWFGHVDFGDDRWWAEHRQFGRIAEVSFDNSFASVNLLNYTDDTFPTFLRAQTARARPHENAEYDEPRVLRYESQADIRQVTAAAIGSSRKRGQPEKPQTTKNLERRDVSSLQVLGNSRYRLLVMSAGSLQVVNVSAHPGRGIAARTNSKFQVQHDTGISSEAVLKTYAIDTGFLVELADEIRLITPHGSYSLMRRPTARVRTFIHSRRYQDAVLVVEEDGVSLLGFLYSSE